MHGSNATDEAGDNLFAAPPGTPRPDDLDIMTQWYLGKLAKLSRREQALVDAMIRANVPAITVSDLAKLVVAPKPGRNPQSVIAATFGSLLRKRIVETVPGGKRGRKLRRIKDQQFVRWYAMRYRVPLQYLTH